MIRKLLASAALAVGFAGYAFTSGGGCLAGSGDCESFCKNEQAGKCTSVKDCAKFCAANQKIADESGCVGPYSAVVGCTSAQVDACAVRSCSTQQAAFQSCAAPYCTKNAAECSAAAGD